MKVPFFFLLIAGISLSAFAQTKTQSRSSLNATLAGRSQQMKQLEGKTIGEIRFEGLKRIEKDAVLSKLVLKEGQTFRQALLKADVQSLYQMGYFNAITVDGQAGGDGKARLKWIFKERPVIASLEIQGNEKISTDDLKEVIKVKEWSILDVNKAREDVALIQKHYEEKGFYLAKVTYAVSTPDKEKPDEVHLTYKVNDYDKVRIRKITFLNNSVFTDEQLKAVFQETREGGFLSFLTSSGNFKEASFKQDLQRLTLWYLDHGYVKFRYDNPVVTVSEDKKDLYISVYLEEGEKYKMGKTDFSGDLLFPKEELAQDILLKDGEIFAISKRNQDIQKLTEKYQDLGYAFVNVIPKMNIKDEDRTVDIDYQFEKGNLVYFGEIRVVGNTKTYDKVIRRELRIYEGELFNGTNLRISRERVERLGYFAPGEVVFNQITRKGRDDLLDLEISVKERSTGTITLGAGFSSGSGFFFQAQVSEINLLGKGQELKFTGQYSSYNNKRLSVGFTDPYAFDTKWNLGGDIFGSVFPLRERYDLLKYGFNIRAGYPIIDDVSGFITYKSERTKLMNPLRPETAEDRLDSGLLSSVIWTIVRDKRNNRYETSGGNYQSASLETAGIGPLGGDKSFVKLSLNNRFYARLIGDLVFRNTVEFGHIFRANDRGVPPSERFFLGGVNDLRGYSFQKVGPMRTNANGVIEADGGLVQMYSLFELEYPLIREAGLKWVSFFDVGNAFSKWPGSVEEPFHLLTDVGLGLRWYSPIGPLRFEWGWPLNKRPSDEEGPVFQFMIGQPF